MGKRIIRPISVLLVIFLVFQLIPGTLNSDQNFQTHSQSSEVVRSANLLNHSILFVLNESQKAFFHGFPIKMSSISTYLIFKDNFYFVNLFFEGEPFDYRTVINQSILHYFNGSKYK